MTTGGTLSGFRFQPVPGSHEGLRSQAKWRLDLEWGQPKYVFKVCQPCLLFKQVYMSSAAVMHAVFLANVWANMCLRLLLARGPLKSAQILQLCESCKPCLMLVVTLSIRCILQHVSVFGFGGIQACCK